MTEAPPDASPRARPALEALVVAASSLVVFAVYYRPWSHGWHTPLFSGGDANFHTMLAQTMIERGWFAQTPLLGVPFGQQLADFPLGDNRLHLLLLRALTLAISDPYVAISAFMALTFVLVALSAYLVARVLGVGVVTAAVVALLYAWLPYHLSHGGAHLFLSAYYAIPLGVLLTLWVLDDAVPLLRRSVPGWSGPRRRGRLIAVALIAVVLGSTGAYYAAFIVVVLLAVAAIAAFRRATLRPLVTGLAVSACVAVVLIANLSPSLWYRYQHGANDLVGHRTAAESEIYGLPLANLVIPQPDFWGETDPVAVAKTVGVPTEGGVFIGAVAAAGLAVSLLALVAPARRPGRRLALTRRLGAIIVAAMLVGTIGGVGYAIALAGFTQLRGWNRIVVLIAFAALLAVALFVDPWVKRAWRRSRPAVVVITVVVLGTGLIVQMPGAWQPDRAAAERTYGADRDFVRGMEAALPSGATVFQLPAIPFPESPPVGRMVDYDLLTGYLLGTGRLGWSYGGVKGRRADWYPAWGTQQPERVVRGAAAAGFDALYVDTFGYGDGGAGLDAAIAPIVGPARSASADGRLRWYDLRPLRKQLDARLGPRALAELRSAVLATPTVTPTGDLYPTEHDARGAFHWMGRSGALEITNHAAPRPVTVRFVATGAPGATVRVRAPGLTRRFTIDDEGTPVQVLVNARTGTTRVELETDAPAVPSDPRQVRIQLRDLTVTDPVVERLLPGTAASI